MHGPAPPASRYASVSSRQRAGVESESNRIPTPSRAARRTAVKPIAALTTGMGSSAQALIAGSPASAPGSLPSRTRVTVSSAAANCSLRRSIVAPMISKSSGSAPDATPSPTRPGKRAASHATSSATSAGGRSGSSSGDGAAHPAGIASRHHPAACNGFGRYPWNPPWCSLVMTPSKPCSIASAACARSSATIAGAGRSLWG